MSEQQLSNPTSTPGGYLVNVKLHSAKAVADVLSSLNIKKDLVSGLRIISYTS